MVMLAAAVVSVALVGALVYLLFKLAVAAKDFSHTCYLFRQFPHNAAHPLWGNLFDFPDPDERGLKFQREMVATFPRVWSAWLGPFFPMLVVNHPDTVKIVLKTSEPKARRTYHLMEPWIGDGLILTKGNKWARNRRLLTPAFHFDILRPYLTVKNRAANTLVNKLHGYHEKGTYFEVFDVVTRFTLDVVLKCAFSYDTDCQQLGDLHPYVQAVFGLSDSVVQRFFQPWFHNDAVYFLTPMGRKFLRYCKEVHSVAEEVIHKRKLALDKHGPPVVGEKDRKRRYLDFLDILLTASDENGEGLKPEEIRDEVDTFLAAGSSTVASAISWTMFSLAEHPGIQADCQKEVDELLEGRKSDDILWEDFSRLPYLTMCIKEAMRLNSPVPFIQRELTRDTEIDGCIAPAGTVVSIVIYNIHHNPTIWDNSTEYQPKRFSEENCSARDPYAFIPFSAGPRNCIGQTFAMHEIKLVMARLLHRFTLVLDPHHNVERFLTVVMKSKTGIRMKAVPRNYSH